MIDQPQVSQMTSKEHEPVAPSNTVPTESMLPVDEKPSLVHLGENTNGTSLIAETPDQPAEFVPSKGAKSYHARKGFSPKMAVALVGIVLLVVGAGVGLFLTSKKQDIRQQASGGAYAQPSCGSTLSGSQGCVDASRYATCFSGTWGSQTYCPTGCSNGACNRTSSIPACSDNRGNSGNPPANAHACEPQSHTNAWECNSGYSYSNGQCTQGSSRAPTPVPSPTIAICPDGSLGYSGRFPGSDRAHYCGPVGHWECNSAGGWNYSGGTCVLSALK